MIQYNHYHAIKEHLSTNHNKIRSIYRPVYINLLQIKLPVSAIMSITHRLSGIYNFFITLPVALYLLYYSTKSYNDFILIQDTLSNPNIISTFVTFSFLVYSYHILTGIRHLLQDIHIGESLSASRTSAYMVLIVWFSLFFLLMMRLYLWKAHHYFICFAYQLSLCWYIPSGY